MSELDRVDESQEILDFSKEAYNTVFTYPLRDEYHYRIAKTGFDDLRETILYVMLFSTPLKEIELISHENGGKRVCYSRGEDNSTGSGNLRILVINERESADDSITNETKNHILYYSDGVLTLVAGFGDDRRFKVFSDKLPRIFADFPLIGAEAFPFPVIINSRTFKVNEPRSGITLVDNENSPDAIYNKRLITSAVAICEIY